MRHWQSANLGLCMTSICTPTTCAPRYLFPFFHPHSSHPCSSSLFFSSISHSALHYIFSFLTQHFINTHLYSMSVVPTLNTFTSFQDAYIFSHFARPWQIKDSNGFNFNKNLDSFDIFLNYVRTFQDKLKKEKKSPFYYED